MSQHDFVKHNFWCHCWVFDVLFSCFSRLKIANFDFNVKCRQIAEVTEGLSGREISKIAIAWQVSKICWPRSEHGLKRRLETRKVMRTSKNYRAPIHHSTSWPAEDRHVPSNDPSNNCGTHFGSSPLLVSPVADKLYPPTGGKAARLKSTLMAAN